MKEVPRFNFILGIWRWTKRKRKYAFRSIAESNNIFSYSDSEETEVNKMGISGKPNTKELRKRGDIDGLIKALEHEDTKVRRDAASALEKIAGKIADEKTVPLLKKAVEPLIKALKDENAEVRIDAAHALGHLAVYRIVDEKAVEPLKECLKDKNVAWSAASTLASIPIPVTLEEGERLVRQIEDVYLEGLPYSFSRLLLLTNRRLIFNGLRVDGSFSYEIPLADIVSCEVKKSIFGKKKIAVAGRQAVFKQRLQLETGVGAGATTTYSWKEVGTDVLREPKLAVFKGIKQPETLKSEIMEQVESRPKYCLKCGAVIPVEATFCPECGAAQ